MCGIFGVTHQPEASNMTYLGLYSLQHRGQEAAGIVSTNGQQMFKVKRQKLVSDAFDEKSLASLKGDFAIGHLRYSTTGENSRHNIQPFSVTGSFGQLSISHNGNLTNYRSLKKELESKGSIFQSTMDTEVILHLIAHSKKASLKDKIKEALEKLEGAFSLLILAPDFLMAARDRFGFRPLVMGKQNQAHYFSSETCAFDLLEAKYEREIQPGEMFSVERNGDVSSMYFGNETSKSNCIFEHVYFARPDSFVFGQSAYQVRKQLGKELAKQFPVDADFVVPVPDSGNFAAMGYAQESGIPFEMAFIRNHYIGRTFIEPKQSIRSFGVKIKLNPVKEILKGKRVVIIDDSIVRGTTSKKIIKMLRDVEVAHITMLISSPPFISPCYYGIDTPNQEELIASRMNEQEIGDYIGADRIGYLSLEGMYESVKQNADGFCDACFTKNYPQKILPQA